jgi:hypothetical protein
MHKMHKGVGPGPTRLGLCLFADTLGQGLFASSLLPQAADLIGARGLTFVLILANECVLAALRPLASAAKKRPDRPPAVRRTTASSMRSARLSDPCSSRAHWCWV